MRTFFFFSLLSYFSLTYIIMKFFFAVSLVGYTPIRLG